MVFFKALAVAGVRGASTCAATRFLRFLAASVTLAGFAFAVPAYAQNTLVTNLTQPNSTANPSMTSDSSIAAAQGFTTGIAAFTLTEVVVDIVANADPADPYGTPAFAVYGSTSDGQVDFNDKLGDLSGSAITAGGRYSVTSPGMALEADTQYFVVMGVSTGDASLTFRRTYTWHQISSYGWTIRNRAASVLLSDGTFYDQATGGPIKIEIKGTVDTPWVANRIPDQNATAGIPFSYTFPANTFAHQDNNPLSYTASGPHWLSFDAGTRTFTGTPHSADTGAASVTVTADDGNGASISDTFDITVGAGINLVPSLGVLVSNLGENGDSTGELSSTDEAQAFTTGAIRSGYELDSVEFQLTVGAVATYGVGIWSSDEEVARTADGDNVHEPHTSLGALNCPTLAVNAGYVTYKCTTDGIDLEANTTYLFVIDSGSSSNNVLSKTNSNSEDTGGVADWNIRDVSVTRSRHSNGNWSQNNAAVRIRINGAAKNAAPRVANEIADQEAGAGVPFSYTIPVNVADRIFADADNDPLSFSAERDGGGALPSWLSFDAAARTFSGTPPSADAGERTSVRVTASDGRGGSASDTFDIVVTFAALVSNLDEDVNSRRNVASNSGSNAAAQHFTTGSGGGTLQEVTVSIKAASRYGSPDFALYSSIDDNGVPKVGEKLVDLEGGRAGPGSYTVAPASPYQLGAGVTYFVVLEASSGTLKFEATNTNQSGKTGWAIGDTPSTFYVISSRTSPNGYAGAIRMRIGGAAGGGANNAPTVANPIPDQDVVAGTRFTYVWPSNAFADADSVDTLSYAVTLSDGSALPDWLAYRADKRLFSGTAPSAQTVTVKVTASDGRGGSVSDEFDIVAAANLSARMLVANVTSDGDGADPPVGNHGRISQQFTTGSNSDGYDLTSIGVQVLSENLSAGETFTVRIYEGSETSVLYTLTSPDSYRENSVNRFEAPAGATLKANTTYRVQFVGGGNHFNDFKLDGKIPNREDIGSLPGWSIADAYLSNGTPNQGGVSVMMSVHGHVRGSGSLGQQVELGDPLTVSLESAPDAHDGSSAFTVRLRFSDTLKNGKLGEKVVEVTGGTHEGSSRASNVIGELWDIRVTPDGNGDVTLALEGSDECVSGIACTEGDLRPLSADFSVTVPGPDEEETTNDLTAWFVAPDTDHDGETPFPIRIGFSERLKNGKLGEKVVRIDGGAHGGSERIGVGDEEIWQITVTPDGTGNITITLVSSDACGSGIACTEGDLRPLSATIVHEVQGPALFSVADAEAEEGTDSNMTFTVTLDRALAWPATVDYATSDNTALSPADYTATSGALTFSAGQTSKTVQVPIVNDAHDDDGETFTFTLSNPVGAAIDDATATGTIHNGDPMPNAWLSRFGRAASDQAAEAIRRRVEQGPRETELTVGGRRVRLPGDEGGFPAAPEQAASLLRMPQAEGWALQSSGARGWHGFGGFAPAGGFGSLFAPGPGNEYASDNGHGLAVGAFKNGASSGNAFPGDGGDGTLTGNAFPSGDGTLTGNAFPSTDGLSSADMRFGTDRGGFHLPGARDILMNSSFFYSQEAEDGAGSGPRRLTAWGETAASRFSGAEDELRLDGEVSTAVMGVDAEWGRWLAGVALSHSAGAGAYAQSGAGGGEIESTLTSVNPYAHYRWSDRTTFWGTLGFGAGGLALLPSVPGADGTEAGETGAVLETKLTNAMAAFGGRGVLTAGTAGGAGFELALRSDALLTHTASQAVAGLSAGEGSTSRLRLLLEGSGSIPAFGGMLDGRLEGGLRHDGGDAETGAGFEFGGGAGWRRGAFALQFDARKLLTHQDASYAESGYSAQVEYRPGADGRGLLLRLGASLGASQGGVENLWRQRDARGFARGGGNRPLARRAQAEFGFGFGAEKLWYPYLAVDAAGQGGRATRLGLKLTSGGAFDAALEFGRRETAPGAPPEDAALLQGQWRF